MISLALAFDSYAQNFVARTYFDIIHYHGSFINLCSKFIWNAVMVLRCLNIVILFLQNYIEHTMLWIVLFFLLDRGKQQS